MADEVVLDDRGRITIPQAFRRFFRERIVLILTPRGILMRPVPEELPDRGRLPQNFRDISGDEAAGDEIDEELKTVHGRRRK